MTEETKTFPVLYILMRNDMDSMNAGKAMAQASHASNAFVRMGEALFNFNDTPIPSSEIDKYNMFETWKGETPQGFGTVLVLAVNETQMRTVADIARSTGHIAGVVNDPTYPLRDGSVCHFLDIDTCAYVFGSKDDPILKAIVGNFPLHP